MRRPVGDTGRRFGGVAGNWISAGGMVAFARCRNPVEYVEK